MSALQRALARSASQGEAGFDDARADALAARARSRLGRWRRLRAVGAAGAVAALGLGAWSVAGEAGWEPDWTDASSTGVPTAAAEAGEAEDLLDAIARPEVVVPSNGWFAENLAAVATPRSRATDDAPGQRALVCAAGAAPERRYREPIPWFAEGSTRPDFDEVTVRPAGCDAVWIGSEELLSLTWMTHVSVLDGEAFPSLRWEVQNVGTVPMFFDAMSARLVVESAGSVRASSVAGDAIDSAWLDDDHRQAGLLDVLEIASVFPGDTWTGRTGELPQSVLDTLEKDPDAIVTLQVRALAEGDFGGAGAPVDDVVLEVRAEAPLPVDVATPEVQSVWARHEVPDGVLAAEDLLDRAEARGPEGGDFGAGAGVDGTGAGADGTGAASAGQDAVRCVGPAELSGYAYDATLAGFALPLDCEALVLAGPKALELEILAVHDAVHMLSIDWRLTHVGDAPLALDAAFVPVAEAFPGRAVEDVPPGISRLRGAGGPSTVAGGPSTAVATLWTETGRSGHLMAGDLLSVLVPGESVEGSVDVWHDMAHDEQGAPTVGDDWPAGAGLTLQMRVPARDDDGRSALLLEASAPLP